MTFQTYIGSIANYYCNSGYYLLGNQIRRCNEDGKWTITQILCAICMPISFPNLIANYEEVDDRVQGEYKCPIGWKLDGSEFRTCTESRKWTGTTPKCLRECGALPEITNGEATSNGTLESSVAIYSCNRGHYIWGNNVKVCSRNGTWLGQEVICSICRPLMVPTNGMINYTLQGRQVRAQYTCLKGSLLGSVLTCTDGRWNGIDPICYALSNCISWNTLLFTTLSILDR